MSNDAEPVQKIISNGDLNSSISKSELNEILQKILNERLTKKQKAILEHLTYNKYESATRAVKNLSKLLNCSESCIWDNLNSLKRCGLISNSRIFSIKKLGVT